MCCCHEFFVWFFGVAVLYGPGHLCCCFVWSFMLLFCMIICASVLCGLCVAVLYSHCVSVLNGTSMLLFCIVICVAVLNGTSMLMFCFVFSRFCIVFVAALFGFGVWTLVSVLLCERLCCCCCRYVFDVAIIKGGLLLLFSVGMWSVFDVTVLCGVYFLAVFCCISYSLCSFCMDLDVIVIM